MMYRVIAFALSTLLMAGLCVPAMGAQPAVPSEGKPAAPSEASAGTADERLTRVTQAVKDVLDLNTEDYAEFRGTVHEQELGTVWSLSWSGDSKSLNVEALEDGTVVSYWRNDGDENYVYTPGLPRFPKLDTAAAQKAAEAFLVRVLDEKTESVELKEPERRGLNATAVSFSGVILLNGLSSPLRYSVTVRGSDNAVTSFRRDVPETSYLGAIPSPTPAVSQADAAAKLRETLDLEPVYVTDEKDDARAVLRWVPKNDKTKYVDAQTGALVDPADELYFYKNTNGTEEMAMDAGGAAPSAARALTETELSGIRKLEGVQDKEALDRLVRAESAYQLDAYTLSSARYSIVKEGRDEREVVLCSLRYTAPENEEGFTPDRSFTVDARSGAVRSLYSSAWRKENSKAAVAFDTAKKTAEAFLKRYSVHAADYALRDAAEELGDGAAAYDFPFVRRVNGYFFPENSCLIQIDCMTGAVCGLSCDYDEEISFDAAEGLISKTAAMDAWMGTYDVALGYRAQAKELDKNNPAEARLIELGMTRFRALLLTYALERETGCAGIDAKTGKPVTAENAPGELRYGDLSGSWAERFAAALAEYGVGYEGGSFRPDKALTQWDLTALLASTQGYRLDPDKASKEERESAYSTVYYMGALKRSERSDDAALTRGELVRCLLNASGCESVAKLSGIFACDYADRDAIPAEELGYAALARGFGLVHDDAYNGSAPATRAMAAVMLCRLMSR